VVGANLLTNASNGDLVAKVIEKAAASCRVVISLSQVHDWTGREAYAYETVASHAGLLIGNEVEVDALMSLSGLSVSPETTLITTKGARGATARDATGEISVPATTHERFVNTLGAGDQFLAGYLMGQILQRGVEDSLNIGVRCADLIIQKNEARPPAGESWAQLL
jgi:sugar/nucleoside kinase (ribokinase family)